MKNRTNKNSVNNESLLLFKFAILLTIVILVIAIMQLFGRFDLITIPKFNVELAQYFSGVASSIAILWLVLAVWYQKKGIEGAKESANNAIQLANNANQILATSTQLELLKTYSEGVEGLRGRLLSFDEKTKTIVEDEFSRCARDIYQRVHFNMLDAGKAVSQIMQNLNAEKADQGFHIVSETEDIWFEGKAESVLRYTLKMKKAYYVSEPTVTEEQNARFLVTYEYEVAQPSIIYKPIQFDQVKNKQSDRLPPELQGILRRSRDVSQFYKYLMKIEGDLSPHEFQTGVNLNCDYLEYFLCAGLNTDGILPPDNSAHINFDRCFITVENRFPDNNNVWSASVKLDANGKSQSDIFFKQKSKDIS